MNVTEGSSNNVVPLIPPDPAFENYVRANGAGQPPLGLTYFEQCAAFAKKAWILKGIIARGETSGWIAPPGLGKSALLTEIAVHCAADLDWRGHRVKEACGVVYFALERADLCKRRLHAYAMRDGIEVLPIAVCGAVIDLLNPNCVWQIIATVRMAEQQFGRYVGLIVIDTFNKAIAANGGDEDKARDQNRAAANLRKVQEILGVHIALVGHTGKNEERGARGSNAHLGDVDVMVQISGDDTKVAVVTKGNDQAERTLTQFRIEPFELGIDDDGDTVTTGIVASGEITDSPTGRPSREPKLSANQKTMFGLLHAAGPAGLSTADWNAKAREIGIGVKRKADHHDIRARLKDLGMVREYAGTWFVCQ